MATDGGTVEVTGLVSSISEVAFRSSARIRLFAGDGPRPESAHLRGYLRAGLPALYQDDGFGMRFVGGFESVLDPIVAILDSLPSYLRAELAPHDMLELLSAWLGQELDEALPREHRRVLIRRAAELGRLRGTAAGLQLALDLAYPSVRLRVEDGGKVVWGAEAASLPSSGPPEVVVYCEQSLSEERLAEIARFIERSKPVHVGYRLRVRRRKTA